MTDGRKMTSRIPCTSETHKELKDLTLGVDATFDDVLRYMMRKTFGEFDDAPLLVGHRHREEFQKWLEEETSESD